MEFVRVKPVGLGQVVLGSLHLTWALITPRTPGPIWLSLLILAPGAAFLSYGLLRMALPHRVQVAPDRVVVVSRLRTRRELLRGSLRVALAPVPTWTRLLLEVLASSALISLFALLVGLPAAAAAAAGVLIAGIYGVRLGVWRRKERLVLRGQDERGRRHVLRLTTGCFDHPWSLCATLLAASRDPLPA